MSKTSHPVVKSGDTGDATPARCISGFVRIESSVAEDGDFPKLVRWWGVDVGSPRVLISRPNLTDVFEVFGASSMDCGVQSSVLGTLVGGKALVHTLEESSEGDFAFTDISVDVT